MKMPDTGVPMLRLECRCFFYFRLILCKQYSSNTKTKAIYTTVGREQNPAQPQKNQKGE